MPYSYETEIQEFISESRTDGEAPRSASPAPSRQGSQPQRSWEWGARHTRLLLTQLRAAVHFAEQSLSTRSATTESTQAPASPAPQAHSPLQRDAGRMRPSKPCTAPGGRRALLQPERKNPEHPHTGELGSTAPSTPGWEQPGAAPCRGWGTTRGRCLQASAAGKPLAGLGGAQQRTSPPRREVGTGRAARPTSSWSSALCRRADVLQCLRSTRLPCETTEFL